VWNKCFFTNAKKISLKRKLSDETSCANPLLPHASEACCNSNSRQKYDHALRSPDYLYDQERVLYSTAALRCDAMGMASCDFHIMAQIDRQKIGYHWTSVSCVIQAKVNAVGGVALVYESQSDGVNFQMHPHIRQDNRNYFKVYWEGDYPKNNNDVAVGNSCGNNACESLVTGGCLCGTSIIETHVFEEMPKTVDEVLSKLRIGAYDTSAYDTGSYAEAISINGITAYLSASSEIFDTKTVFEVTDKLGRLHRFKNTKELVQIQGAKEYAFRNAPSFISVLNTESNARDAYYETEAALDHYFHHDNTAPFIAFRLIQRFTTSNPNPRYVKEVATAFRTGTYNGIGSGVYGDLASTIAAILLHAEARSVHLDANPFKGNLREPLLRLLTLVRGMELQQDEGHPIVKMDNLDTRIGQVAHGFPTVFSFMLPEYAPGGRPGDGTLVGPETMVMDMPTVVGLLNGMFSLIRYGLCRCRGGFGTEGSTWNCYEADFSSANAQLSFKRPFENKTISIEDHAKNVIRELSTILTSGRLSTENKNLIMDAYISKYIEIQNMDQKGENMKGEIKVIIDPGEAALRLSQQLVLSTPEFHTNNIVKKNGSPRGLPERRQASGTPYKAIVNVMFKGGCDSFNMLVPHTCTKGTDLYAEYSTVREDIAISRNLLLELNEVSNQVCEKFGVHPNLGALKAMFDDGDLLFFANTGDLTKETTKENYLKDTESTLFAHNHMQRAAQRIDPLKAKDGTGILGRMRDALTRQGLSVGAFSIDDNSISVIGENGVTTPSMILSRSGIEPFNVNPSSDDMNDAMYSLNGDTKAESSGVFAEFFSRVLLESLSQNKLLYDNVADKSTEITFPTSAIGEKLAMVAKMIDSREERGTDADVFFVAMGGWDTHDRVLSRQEYLFNEADASFKAFADEMKAKNIWDRVTLIETSEFARTLTPNTGRGSDHAWAGNYVAMGGSVVGGQIVGKYPDDITDDGTLNVGRGR